MLGILSIIFLLLILIISLFFIYYNRFMPNKKKSIEIQSTIKKTQNEPVACFKKSNKKKKNQKNITFETDNKTNVDEINENVIKNVEDSPTSDIVILDDPDVELKIVEEKHQTQEAECYPTLSEIRDIPSPDQNININQLTQQIKQFETENNQLNIKLEEATENCLHHKQEADSLKEENKNIKSKITKLERQQGKNDEKCKKTEKSLAESVGKITELEKHLSDLNAENAEVKANLISLTGRLKKTESELSSEHDKLVKFQCEKENVSKKYEDLFAKCTLDDKNHKNMYQRYEDKIGELNAEKGQMSDDFTNMRKLVTEKDDQISQLHSELTAATALFEQIKDDNHTISQRYNGLCEELKTKAVLLESSEIERNRLLDQVATRSEIEIKLQEKCRESEKKDSIIDDLQNRVSMLKNEIENISQAIILKNDELSAELINSREQLEIKNSELAVFEEANFVLTTEIKTLSANQHHKNEELDSQLLALCQNLKEKDCDLATLQDQKLELLNEIDHLKREVLGKNEEILKASDLMNARDEVTRQLLFEKGNFQTKLDKLKKELRERDEKCAKVNEEFDTQNREFVASEKEKSILQKQLGEIEGKRAELHKLVGKKDEEIQKINQAYIEMRDQYDELEKRKETISIFHDNIEDVITETRQNFVLQSANLCLADDSSRTANEMQSHITKLETELLLLQRKYFDLKNANLAASSAEDKSAPHIEYHRSESVSIAPVVVDQRAANDLFDDGADKSSATHIHLLESIEKLNSEISQQRLKNQDLQKSFNDSSSDRTRLQAEYSQLLERYNAQCVTLEAVMLDFGALKQSSSHSNDAVDTVRTLESQLNKLKDDNRQLLVQVEHYRETLQKTEFCLENIQASVDQEENNWKICLKSSEQEQERLEQKIKDLLIQIDDLRSKKDSESPIPVTVSDDAPPVLNGSLSSEVTTTKKKKRKTKKKKNKARVAAATTASITITLP